ncbi:glycoside hydrolase family 15 protein [Streptomyces sp. NPDC091204]|uniref:glycoside hydrolase family 15 protein n=1 Tax=Streptomyces sp. NPDC091204 TaxID=3155299 RepID=UPI003432F346
MWEVRSEPQHFLYSKLMCWVALDRALDLAGDLGAQEPHSGGRPATRSARPWNTTPARRSVVNGTTGAWTRRRRTPPNSSSVRSSAMPSATALLLCDCA